MPGYLVLQKRPHEAFQPFVSGAQNAPHKALFSIVPIALVFLLLRVSDTQNHLGFDGKAYQFVSERLRSEDVW